MTVMDVSKAEAPDLDFAGRAAKDVYDNWDDSSYRNAFLMALGTYIENMIWQHRHEWQDLVNEAAENTSSKARRAVVKAYLATALEEISKDTTRVRDYTRGGQHVRGYDRNYTRHGPGGFAARNPMAFAEASDEVKMDRAAELGRTVNAFTRFGSEGDARPQAMHFTIEHEDGKLRDAVSRDGKLPRLNKGERVTSYKPIGLDQPVTLGGETFNVMQALGASPNAAGYGGGISEGVQSLAQKRGDHYAMIHDASKTFYKLSGGPAGAPAAQAAALMGIYVGKHGPEVSRVLGPHIRRYTYKYRGMTATPTQKARVASDGKQSGESNEAYEFRLAHALASGDTAKGGMGTIPTEQQNALLLATGSTAPSHGFILDKAGVVKQQAVGASDDHYVPFNLAQLHALNGGSYVRSRAYGGPTTEDLSLALRTGAKRASVVSRHGMYTIELEQRANGVRSRYGDVPVVVVNRYGRLLDGIKNGSLKDPETGETLKLNGHGYDVALKALKTQFPLLIKDVKYFPPKEVPALATNKETAGAHGKEDTGYVRPLYLKPSAAVNGYYDDALGFDGQSHSYDEHEGYRSHKATLLLAERDARIAAQTAAEKRAAEKAEAERQQRAAERQGNFRRDGNQQTVRDGHSPVPANLYGPARAQAEAGGGTSSAEVLRDPPLDVEDTAKVLRYAHHVIALNNNNYDHEVVDIKNHLENLDSDDGHVRRPAEEWLHEIRTNADARTNLFDLLTRITPTDRDTGIAKVQLPDLPSAGDNNPVSHDDENADDEPTEAWHKGLAGSPKDREENAALYAEYQRYDHLTKLEKDPNLGEKGKAKLAALREEFDAPDPDDPNAPTLREQWAVPNEEFDNMPYHHYYENQLHRARYVDAGGDLNKYRPLHKPPEDSEPTFEKIRRAQVEDPEAAQKAQDDWERDIMNGLNPEDYG